MINLKARVFLSLQSILLICLCFNFSLAYSQTEPVIIEKSTERIIIDDVVFYVHTVKKGQTLYSISKEYNVSFKDLIQYNPEVMYGLMIGQVLKIPEVVEIKEEQEEGNYYYHEVQKGETLYSLMKKYKVDTTIVYGLNPDVRAGLKYNMILKIPKIKAGAVADDEEYVFYKVKRKDTLYSLSREFNVSIKDIKEANEELKTSQLKYGQYIRIPKYTMVVSTFGDEYQGLKDTSTINYDSIKFADKKEYNCELINLTERLDTINVALLIPFYLEENKALNPTDTILNRYTQNNKEFRIYRKTCKFLEFYEGLLIAVDSLRRMGISINLNIFSVENDTNDIKWIVDSIRKLDVQLVIGPVYRKAVKKIADEIRYDDIKIVVPFVNENDLLLNNPNLFMVRNSKEYENYLIAELLSNYYDCNIVLVNPKTFVDSIKLADFKKDLYPCISKKTDFNKVRIKEVLYNDTLQKSLDHSLSKYLKNVVFINSTKETFVSEIITKLNGLLLYYDIEVIGYPMWQWFIKLDVEYFHNLNVKYMTPFFVDYENEEIKNFLKKYHEFYYTEPSRFSYSFIGYDIMLYFGTAVHQYGKEFPHCLSNMDIDLTHSDFYFYKHNKTSGFENLSENLYNFQPGLKLVKYNSIEEFVKAK